jgi:hypothetical protein
MSESPPRKRNLEHLWNSFPSFTCMYDYTGFEDLGARALAISRGSSTTGTLRQKLSSFEPLLDLERG